MRSSRLIALAAAAAWTSTAAAQATSDTKQFAVIGMVPAMCSSGTLVGGDSTFDLGVLIDTSTGLLRSDLSSPPKSLTGAFCSTRSTISIEASPLTAQNYTAAAPAGFARSVDYTATAAGWTPAPAVYATAASSNPAATQTRDTAFTGTISVALGSFATTGGATLRLVSDASYQGNVTVTLAVAD